MVLGDAEKREDADWLAACLLRSRQANFSWAVVSERVSLAIDAVDDIEDCLELMAGLLNEPPLIDNGQMEQKFR